MSYSSPCPHFISNTFLILEFENVSKYRISYCRSKYGHFYKNNNPPRNLICFFIPCRYFLSWTSTVAFDENNLGDVFLYQAATRICFQPIGKETMKTIKKCIRYYCDTRTRVSLCSTPVLLYSLFETGRSLFSNVTLPLEGV